MELHGIPANRPISRLRPDAIRRQAADADRRGEARRDGSESRPFDEAATDAGATTPEEVEPEAAAAGAPADGSADSLQPTGSVIRRDHESGRWHVDVLA